MKNIKETWVQKPSALPYGASWSARTLGYGLVEKKVAPYVEIEWDLFEGQCEGDSRHGVSGYSKQGFLYGFIVDDEFLPDPGTTVWALPSSDEVRPDGLKHSTWLPSSGSYRAREGEVARAWELAVEARGPTERLVVEIDGKIPTYLVRLGESYITCVYHAGKKGFNLGREQDLDPRLTILSQWQERTPLGWKIGFEILVPEGASLVKKKVEAPSPSNLPAKEAFNTPLAGLGDLLRRSPPPCRVG